MTYLVLGILLDLPICRPEQVNRFFTSMRSNAWSDDDTLAGFARIYCASSSTSAIITPTHVAIRMLTDCLAWPPVPQFFVWLGPTPPGSLWVQPTAGRLQRLILRSFPVIYPP